MWELIQKLTLNRGINIGTMIFGNLVAPYWFIFQVIPNIYEHTELPKLIMLSLCIGTPISLFNYVIVSIATNTDERKEQENKEEKKKEQQFSMMAFASFLTASTLYCTTGLYGLQDCNKVISLNKYPIVYIAILEYLFFTSAAILWYIENKKKKKAMPPA